MSICVPCDEYLRVMLCTFNPCLSVEGLNMGAYGLVMVSCCDMVMINLQLSMVYTTRP